jgi:ethanolamine-phosphate phospho-lyase
VPTAVFALLMKFKYVMEIFHSLIDELNLVPSFYS